MPARLQVLSVARRASGKGPETEGDKEGREPRGLRAHGWVARRKGAEYLLGLSQDTETPACTHVLPVHWGLLTASFQDGQRGSCGSTESRLAPREHRLLSSQYQLTAACRASPSLASPSGHNTQVHVQTPSGSGSLELSVFKMTAFLLPCKKVTKDAQTCREVCGMKPMGTIISHSRTEPGEKTASQSS